MSVRMTWSAGGSVLCAQTYTGGAGGCRGRRPAIGWPPDTGTPGGERVGAVGRGEPQQQPKFTRVKRKILN